MRQVPSSLCETGNKQGLLPFSSQEMRPRQLLSFLDKEKAQQPWSAALNRLEGVLTIVA